MNVPNNANIKNRNLILIFVIIILSIVVVFKFKKDLYILKNFSFELNDNNNVLDLKSINGKLKVKGYDGNKLVLKVKYISKNSKNTNIDFYKTNNKRFILKLEEDKFKKVSIEALLPNEHFKEINIYSKNSQSYLKSIDAKNILIESINSNLLIEKNVAKYLDLNNLNGNIKIKDCIIKNIDLDNVNNNIVLDNCDIKNLNSKNLNSNLEIIEDSAFSEFKGYKWNLNAQNSLIRLVIGSENINYNINAKANNGKIQILKDNFVYSKKLENEIVAKTDSKDKSYKSLNLYLETSNSTIILK